MKVCDTSPAGVSSSSVRMHSKALVCVRLFFAAVAYVSSLWDSRQTSRLGAGTVRRCSDEVIVSHTAPGKFLPAVLFSFSVSFYGFFAARSES